MTIFPKQLGVVRQNAFVLLIIFLFVQGVFACYAENTSVVYPYWKLEPLPRNFYKASVYISTEECLVITQYLSPTIPVRNPTMRLERIGTHFNIFMQLSAKTAPVVCQYNSQSSSHPQLPMWATVSPKDVEKSGPFSPMAGLTQIEAPRTKMPIASEPEQAANAVASIGSRAHTSPLAPVASTSGTAENITEDKNEKVVVGKIKTGFIVTIFSFLKNLPETHSWWAGTLSNSVGGMVAGIPASVIGGLILALILQKRVSVRKA